MSDLIEIDSLFETQLPHLQESTYKSQKTQRYETISKHSMVDNKSTNDFSIRGYRISPKSGYRVCTIYPALCSLNRGYSMDINNVNDRIMSTRRGKTVAQQCKHYEVENIFDYMYESHFASCDPKQVRRLYKELNRDARRQFIEYCFDEMNPEYRREIILKVIE